MSRVLSDVKGAQPGTPGVLRGVIAMQVMVLRCFSAGTLKPAKHQALKPCLFQYRVVL